MDGVRGVGGGGSGVFVGVGVGGGTRVAVGETVLTSTVEGITAVLLVGVKVATGEVVGVAVFVSPTTGVAVVVGLLVGSGAPVSAVSVVTVIVGVDVCLSTPDGPLPTRA